MAEARQYAEGEHVPTIAGLTDRLRREETPFRFYRGQRSQPHNADPIAIGTSGDDVRWYVGVPMIMRPLIVDPEGNPKEGVTTDQETGSTEIRGHTLGYDGKTVTPYTISLSSTGNQLLVGEELYPLSLDESRSYKGRT
jgi:hypothetical protein